MQLTSGQLLSPEPSDAKTFPPSEPPTAAYAAVVDYTQSPPVASRPGNPFTIPFLPAESGPPPLPDFAQTPPVSQLVCDCESPTCCPQCREEIHAHYLAETDALADQISAQRADLAELRYRSLAQDSAPRQSREQLHVAFAAAHESEDRAGTFQVLLDEQLADNAQLYEQLQQAQRDREIAEFHYAPLGFAWAYRQNPPPSSVFLIGGAVQGALFNEISTAGGGLTAATPVLHNALSRVATSADSLGPTPRSWGITPWGLAAGTEYLTANPALRDVLPGLQVSTEPPFGDDFDTDIVNPWLNWLVTGAGPAAPPAGAPFGYPTG